MLRGRGGWALVSRILTVAMGSLDQQRSPPSITRQNLGVPKVNLPHSSATLFWQEDSHVGRPSSMETYCLGKDELCPLTDVSGHWSLTCWDTLRGFYL